MTKKLNGPQENFCLLVAGGKSDVDAYMEARGCSEANAKKNAWIYRDKKGIQARIEELTKAIADKVVDELAFSKLDGQKFLRDIIQTPPNLIDTDSPLCQGRKETKYGLEILVPNKLSALDQLAKQLGWYAAEKTEVTVTEPWWSRVSRLNAESSGLQTIPRN